MLPHLNVSPRPIVQGALWSYSHLKSIWLVMREAGNAVYGVV